MRAPPQRREFVILAIGGTETIVLFSAAIVGVALLFRSLRRKLHVHRRQALMLEQRLALTERFASGDIDEDEYNRKLQNLR